MPLLIRNLNRLKNSVLFSNFFYLSGLQIFNYLLPLILLPYLIRIIGIDKIGLVAFAQAINQYFLVITDYGFDLTATKDISLNRTDNLKRSKIFCHVIFVKLLFSFVIFLILLLLILFIPIINNNSSVFLITYIIVIGQAIFPTWFFQGIEKMKYITYINVGIKSIATLSIFFLVRSEYDFNSYLIINSLSYLFVGLIGMIYTIKKFKVVFTLPTFEDILENIKKGKHIFFSNISISLYISSGIIILGAFTNNLIVGYYSIVEKIIFAIRGFAVIILRSIYPKVCIMATQSSSQLKAFYIRLFKPIGIAFFILSLFLFVFAKYFVILLAGKQIEYSMELLRILSLVPFIVVLNIPAYITLIVFQYEKYYFKVLLLGAVINIISNLVLCNLISAYGTAISVLLTELFITISLYWILNKKKDEFVSRKSQ